MDGFKPMVKMKTGGSVSKAFEEQKKCSGGVMKKCEGGSIKEGNKHKEGGKIDLAQDKALIKKAIAQHDKQEHPGEKTELKLKKGGRDKKKVGTVKKFKSGGAVDNKPAGDKDPIKKVKPTGDKKAAAPSKGTKRSALKGSDVEKEKSKPAGNKDAIKKVKPTGDKKADAPNKAAVKPTRTGENAIDDIDGNLPKFGRGGAISGGAIPPSIAAQLMQAKQDAAMRGQNPAPTGTTALPVDNPVVGGGAPMQAQPAVPPFNAARQFEAQNPGESATRNISPAQIQQILMSPAFRRSNRQFTDR